MITTTECPSCNAPVTEGSDACSSCGLIFWKHRQYQEKAKAHYKSQCPSCKDKTIEPTPSCPSCGLDYKTNKKALKTKTQNGSDDNQGLNKKTDEQQRPLVFFAQVAFLVIIFVGGIGVMIFGEDSPEDLAREKAKQDHMDAYYICQQAIKYVSKDPDNAEIPYVQNFGSGDEYYFAWGRDTKHLRLKNGLGLDVAASASCIVNKGKITQLTIDGKTII